MAKSEEQTLIEEVFIELSGVISKFPTFVSTYEGYAVLLEKVDELWIEVKRKDLYRRRESMRHEAIQVAVMAIRFVMDVIDAKE